MLKAIVRIQASDDGHKCRVKHDSKAFHLSNWKDEVATKRDRWGTWVAQSVKCPILGLALVMILWFVRSSSMLGSVLTAWSLLGIPSLPLSVCPSPAYTHILSLSLKNK